MSMNKPASLRIEGYAIVTADGMLADRHGRIPPELKIDADQRFFEQGLEAADLIVHGKHSHEQQPHSHGRHRLVLTRTVAGLAPHPSLPKAKSWNPAGASFAEACRAVGIAEGLVAVTGGTEVFGLFLAIGYDAFHLSRVDSVRLPDGRPVFPGVPAQAPEGILAHSGLAPGPVRVLDARAQATLVTWQPRNTG
jgi:dihydrofolate reductase